MQIFDEASSSYEKNSHAQREAGEKTLQLLKTVMTHQSAVLDAGCGPGHLTNKIAEMTDGAVLGIDISKPMIALAQSKYKRSNLSFNIQSFDEITCAESYDCIFANSSFYYVQDPTRTYCCLHRALNDQGYLVMQLAYEAQTDSQLSMIVTLASQQNQHVATILKTFNSTIRLYDNENILADELKAAGFTIVSLETEVQQMHVSVTEAISQFSSNLFPNLFNPNNYGNPEMITPEFCELVTTLVENGLSEKVDSHKKIMLYYPRLYVLAKK